MQITVHPDDPSRVQDVLTIVPLTVSFGIIFLVLRLWVKLRMTQAGLGPEDWTIIAAGVISLALAGLTISILNFGWAHHIDDVAPGVNLTQGWKIFYCLEILYFNALTLVKCSILFLLLRLAPPLRFYIYSIFTIVILFDVATTLVLIFQCKPISFAWVPSTVGGTCINIGALYITNGVINILTDLIIYALPIRTLWRLRLPRKQRIGLVMVFSVGLLCVLAALLRIRALTAILGPWDPEWNTIGSILWSQVEVNVGIVCACLACLKPLIAKIVSGIDTLGSLFSPTIGKSMLGSSTKESGSESLDNSNPKPSVVNLKDSRFGSVVSNWGTTTNQTVTECEAEFKGGHDGSGIGMIMSNINVGSTDMIAGRSVSPASFVEAEGEIKRPGTSHTWRRTRTPTHGRAESEIEAEGVIIKKTEVWVVEDRV